MRAGSQDSNHDVRECEADEILRLCQIECEGRFEGRVKNDVVGFIREDCTEARLLTFDRDLKVALPRNKQNETTSVASTNPRSNCRFENSVIPHLK